MARCPKCDNTGLVCENHPAKAWNGLGAFGDGCDCGKGIACDCVAGKIINGVSFQTMRHMAPYLQFEFAEPADRETEH
jgi:hypothetical protein